MPKPGKKLTAAVQPKQIQKNTSAEGKVRKHVLTVYHPFKIKRDSGHNSESDIIQLHVKLLSDINNYNHKTETIFWGKIIEALGKRTTEITKEWCKKVQDMINDDQKSGHSKPNLIITDFHDVYLAELVNCIYNPDTSNPDHPCYQKMPKYYRKLVNTNGLGCEVFFEIRDIFHLSGRTVLFENLFFDEGIKSEMAFSPFEAHVAYPIILQDPNSALTDGYNWNPTLIDHAKGAHFYKLLDTKISDLIKNEIEIENRITTYLIDPNFWYSYFQKRTREYFKTAELTYHETLKDYENKPDNELLHQKLALKYFIAIESMFKENNEIYKIYFHGHSHRDQSLHNFIKTLEENPDQLLKDLGNFNASLPFNDFMETHKLKRIRNFIEKLNKLRVNDAHAKHFYSFREIANLRNQLWGLLTIQQPYEVPIIFLITELQKILTTIYDEKQNVKLVA